MMDSEKMKYMAFLMLMVLSVMIIIYMIYKKMYPTVEKTEEKPAPMETLDDEKLEVVASDNMEEEMM